MCLFTGELDDDVESVMVAGDGDDGRRYLVNVANSLTSRRRR